MGLIEGAKKQFNKVKKIPKRINNNSKTTALIALVLWGCIGDNISSGRRMPLGYVKRKNEQIEIIKKGEYNETQTNRNIAACMKDYHIDFKRSTDDMIVSHDQDTRAKSMITSALYNFTKTNQLNCDSKDDVEKLLEVLENSGGRKILGRKITLLPGRNLPLLGNTRASHDIDHNTTSAKILSIFNNKIIVK